MIVLDASAAVELVLYTASGKRIAKRLGRAGSIHCPHLIDIEITQTLRRLVVRAEVTADRGAAALSHWRDMEIQRYPHLPFLERIWTLRENLSAYDAAYVTLAEVLKAPLITGDRRLARAPGSAARIEVIA